jgi:hypothetical protein
MTCIPIVSEVRARDAAAMITNFGNGVLDIETVNPTCIVWFAGAPDSAFAIQ